MAGGLAARERHRRRVAPFAEGSPIGAMPMVRIPMRRCRSRRPALHSPGSGASTRLRVSTARVVAVGDHDQRLLAPRAPLPEEWPRPRRRTLPCHLLGCTPTSRRPASRRSLVQGWTSSGRSLKRYRNTSSCGSEQVVEESTERRLCGLPFIAHHAAAGIDRKSQAHRHALGIEVRRLLEHAIFVDIEIIFRQAVDETAVAVRDCDSDVDQVHVRSERKALFLRPLLCGREREYQGSGCASIRAFSESSLMETDSLARTPVVPPVIPRRAAPGDPHAPPRNRPGP